MKSVCEKCQHRMTCDRPCRPVELYLQQDNPAVFEKRYINEEGKQVTIMFAKGRVTPQSLGPEMDEEADLAFSTENASPFRHFEPTLKQTGIFIDRFFHKFTYADLATKYDCTEIEAQKIYRAAVQRLLSIIHEVDRARKREKYAKMVKERSGDLPKGQRWFLMNKCLGLLPSEIAEMEGLQGSSSVRQLIIRVSDQLQAGEIKLIDGTTEERQTAKERLDTRRAKRRERHARNKTRKRSQQLHSVLRKMKS